MPSSLSTRPNFFSQIEQWDNDTYSRIINCAKDHPGGTVIFDADGTLWSQDVEQAFFRWLFCENKFVSSKYNQDSYQEFEARLRTDGLAAYKWLLQALSGINENDLNEMAQRFFHDHFVNLIYSAQKRLINDLKKLGMDVWVVSASNQWLIRAGIAYLGIEPSHGIGVRFEVKNDLITDTFIEPFTNGEGKVAAIQQIIQKDPVIVVGDGKGDVAMLNASKGLSVFIKHQGDQQGAEVALALEKGWLVQYFSLTPPIQFERQHLIDTANNYSSLC